MREDPIGIQRGENHLYVYVSNNPIILLDLFGLDRYNPCKGKPPILKQICEKYVDYGCAGGKNIACCEAEKEECRSNLDWETCSKEDINKCDADYASCIADTKTNGNKKDGNGKNK